MPLDTRRICGPEGSHSPYDYCPKLALSLSDLQKQRPDGRSLQQLRPIFLRAGVVSQARGSAYIEVNQTKVICAVYGPREVVRRDEFTFHGQLTCDFKFTTFSCRHRRQHVQDNQEKDLSLQMQEALEPAVCLHKYPKSQINVYVTVLQNDGGALSAAITCASLALVTAGIEMFDIVTASSAAMFENAKIIADPTLQEEEAFLNETGKANAYAGIITLAYLPSVHQVSAISSDGEVTLDTLTQTSKQCMTNCQTLHPTLKQAMVKFLSEQKEKEKENKMDT